VRTNSIFVWTIRAILLAGTIVGVMTAAGQKTAGNSPGGKQWLAAMDTDHDGSVSKQEFTAYMEAQFDKADADHDGTLDANELDQLRKNLSITTK
jgi:Ca2+-binding EF-hand superfamily protein